MQDFTVTWDVNVEAETPVEAAFTAAKSYFQKRIYQGSPGTSCVFYVEDAVGNSTTVALDSEVQTLSPAQLRQLFVTEHPVHTLDNWRAEVQLEDTILGYWEYVQHKLEQDSHEA